MAFDPWEKNNAVDQKNCEQSYQQPASHTTTNTACNILFI